MRNFIIPIALATLIAAAPMAMAATTSTGTIKSLDQKAMSLTLDSGQVYKLPQAYKGPALKVGEKVSLLWDMKGSDHVASAVTIVK